jgi:membrane-bound ClpP family serine protease
MKMLGYIFIFYIGFYFYRLAENHKKNKWLFGIVGIITFVFGNFMYVLYANFFLEQDINEFNILSVSFKSFSSGVLSIFILFHLLNFIWSRKKVIREEEIDKIGSNKN